jgi:membrane-associated phospholipid phosphatase
MNPGMIDYRKLRWNNLNSEQFRHLKLLLFWPIFGILFLLMERGGILHHYHLMHCALDDMIPFCEYFLIPYMFWFVFVVGMLLYTLLFDKDTFKKYMYFIMITYSVTLVIYFFFPSAQHLRPAVFPRNNIFTQFLTYFYAFDTDTNVCPSIHVIGSLAVMFAAWHSDRFKSTGWRIAFALAAILISISTVFIKQHSVLDLLAALPLCFGAYAVVYSGLVDKIVEKKRNPAASSANRITPKPESAGSETTRS